MDLNRYKIFLSVADSGSFTAAAAAWNYTPSGVVHLINALEQEFGFPLFVRTRRGVHLTTDGEQLIAPLRDLVQCDDRLRQVCSKIQGVLTGKVRIGSYYSISAHWLPPVIGRFHRDFPGVQIELMEGHHQLLDGLMNQNRVDLCFYSRVLGGGREWIPLRADPMVAIVPPEHRLASAGAFPIGAYRNEELVISARGNDSDVMHVFNKYRLDSLHQLHDGGGPRRHRHGRKRARREHAEPAVHRRHPDPRRHPAPGPGGVDRARHRPALPAAGPAGRPPVRGIRGLVHPGRNISGIKTPKRLAVRTSVHYNRSKSPKLDRKGECMEIKRAAELLRGLADGRDPITGARLPDESVYNHPEIIRALHCVLQELQTRQTGAQAVNAGRSWRPDEEQQLLEEYDAGLPVEQIARRHGRTAGAIEARLSELGRRDQIQFNMR